MCDSREFTDPPAILRRNLHRPPVVFPSHSAMYSGLARSSLATLTLPYFNADRITHPQSIPHITDILHNFLTPPIDLLAGLIGHHGPIPCSDHAQIHQSTWNLLWLMHFLWLVGAQMSCSSRGQIAARRGSGFVSVVEALIGCGRARPAGCSAL